MGYRIYRTEIFEHVYCINKYTTYVSKWNTLCDVLLVGTQRLETAETF